VTGQPRKDVPADIEVGAAWRAGSGKVVKKSPAKVRSVGDVETEELDERDATRPHGRVWRFRAWLRESR
jgi:hypothetical protein